MADKPNVSAAIADVFKESDDSPAPSDQADGTAPEAEASSEKPDATPGTPPEVGNDVKPDGPQVTDEQIAAFKARYGVDLSVLPDDESRVKFMTEATETQKTISKLQRDLAEAKKEPPAPPAPPAPVEEPVISADKLTDEQIAEALGIDLAQADQRDMLVIGLTRSNLIQQERMDALEKGVTETSRSTTWTRQLDTLEEKFGPLPEDVGRADLMAYAQREGIASAEAAYWLAVGPVRASIAQALDQQVIQLKTAGKKAATTPRPSSSTDVEDKLRSTNVKDAVKEAAEAAILKLGIQLKD